MPSCCQRIQVGAVDGLVRRNRRGDTARGVSQQGSLVFASWRAAPHGQPQPEVPSYPSADGRPANGRLFRCRGPAGLRACTPATRLPHTPGQIAPADGFGFEDLTGGPSVLPEESRLGCRVQEKKASKARTRRQNPPFLAFSIAGLAGFPAGDSLGFHQSSAVTQRCSQSSETPRNPRCLCCALAGGSNPVCIFRHHCALLMLGCDTAAPAQPETCRAKPFWVAVEQDKLAAWNSFLPDEERKRENRDRGRFGRIIFGRCVGASRKMTPDVSPSSCYCCC